MRRSHRITALVMLTALVAVAVGVMVWPTPEEARAVYQLTIHVNVWDEQAQDWVDGTNLPVRFWFDGQWHNKTTDGMGNAYFLADTVSGWLAHYNGNLQFTIIWDGPDRQGFGENPADPGTSDSWTFWIEIVDGR